MAKKIKIAASFFILAAAVFWSFYGTKPHISLDDNDPVEEFSTARAYSHVERLAQQPHFVGSPNHSRVRNYIAAQLEELGLLVETQEGFTLNKQGVYTRPQNIIARIEGSGDGKALLLLTHYDSAMHSSYGASDAGSGVATILEGVRAFLASGKTPVNDIILVFTDAEELGLNGAELFVNEHPWANNVGLVLNFEARGSGGNSFMLLETNGGNKTLLNQFKQAGVNYPVTNSLVYSVYKMLPNDTDLTVFREQGNINGFNFAFIDDHYDYHTATDLPKNLDKNTLAHQGSYLMPLLNYFSSTPLEHLNSEEDFVFFNFPVLSLVTYNYSWIFPMLITAIAIFILLLFYGGFQRRLKLKDSIIGFAPLFLSLFISGLFAYLLWQFALFLYPEYGEMEHGFTYNGYSYIIAVVFLSVAVCLYVYNRFQDSRNSQQLFVGPITFWLLINVLAAFFLKGAAYFIIPVFFALLQFFLLLWKPKKFPLLHTFLSLPAIFILSNFIVMFPVALGLKMLVLTAIFTVLLWVLLWPVFSFYRKNQTLGFFSFLVFMIFFVIAHLESEFSEEHPKPNSLVYLMDADTGVATWNTYDGLLDDYTRPYFGDSREIPVPETKFSSKYGSRFAKTSLAPKIDVPSPYIRVEKFPGATEAEDAYQIKIAPNRDINRIELFADKKYDFNSFTVDGKEAANLQPGQSDLHIFKNRWSDRLLTYYAVNRDTLRINLSLPKDEHPEFVLYEAAFALPQNQQLQVVPRGPDMIPRPFVLNDAILLKRTFKL